MVPTTHRRQLLLAALGACAAVSMVSARTTPQLARPVFVDGQAQVVPAFEKSGDWIRQTLWVETEFDSDADGKRDRVFVDVTRPRQTETEGLKVAVVYESSPYFSGTSGPRKYLWDVKQEVGAVPPPRIDQPLIPFKPKKDRISDSLEDMWVPRGFAVVHSEAPGTGLSQGCVTVGGEPEEKAPKAVIDWLNGRAKGYSRIDGTDADLVTATWSTGKVGMMGTSYNGTIPVAAATTGVKGLEAIIPVAPNTSYYHYYRSNGLVRHPGGWLGEDIDFLYDYINSGDPARRDACNAMIRDGLYVKGRDRQHGDYNSFWADRDLLTKASGIKAAVLMAHAFNDWNVVPEHDFRIAMAVKGRVPLQFYYHQGGHGGNPPMAMMNRWFSRYLYDINNHVEDDPGAFIVREGTGSSTGTLTPYADYPNPEARMVELHPSKGGTTRGGLSIKSSPAQGRETLVDNVEFSGASLAKDASSPNRLIYATPELTQPVHLSGLSTITIRLASSKPAANLSVWLVQLPFADGAIGTANLITRGWADPQNWKSLTTGLDYHSKEPGTPLKPGQFVTLTFMLQPDDQIIPAGKRIALMIMSSDRDFTLWPTPGTELTVDLDSTILRIPVVGGEAKLGAALGVR